MFSYLIH